MLRTWLPVTTTFNNEALSQRTKAESIERQLSEEKWNWKGSEGSMSQDRYSHWALGENRKPKTSDEVNGNIILY